MICRFTKGVGIGVCFLLTHISMKKEKKSFIYECFPPVSSSSNNFTLLRFGKRLNVSATFSKIQ